MCGTATRQSRPQSRRPVRHEVARVEVLSGYIGMELDDVEREAQVRARWPVPNLTCVAGDGGVRSSGDQARGLLFHPASSWPPPEPNTTTTTDPLADRTHPRRTPGRPTAGAGGFGKRPAGPDGQRRQRSKRGFTSKKEAQRFLRDVLADVESGSYAAPERLTLRQWLEDEWLPSRKPGAAKA
jgi:hypothetical protein